MKSIKINSKYTNNHKKYNIQEQNIYKNFIEVRQSAPIHFQIVSIIATICQKIQSQTSLKLNILQHFQKFMIKLQEIKPQSLFIEFKNFIKLTISDLIQKNPKWKKDGQKQIHVRLRSQQKAKIRIVRENEEQSQKNNSNQNQQKLKLIFDLRKSNQLLQKKILNISGEFLELRKRYEYEIQKYKRILHSSLMNLHLEVNKQYYESQAATIKGPMQTNRQSNTTHAKSQYKSSSHYGQKRQARQKQTTKFPIVTNSQDYGQDFNRKFSHKSIFGI